MLSNKDAYTKLRNHPDIVADLEIISGIIEEAVNNGEGVVKVVVSECRAELIADIMNNDLKYTAWCDYEDNESETATVIIRISTFKLI